MAGARACGKDSHRRKELSSPDGMGGGGVRGSWIGIEHNQDWWTKIDGQGKNFKKSLWGSWLILGDSPSGQPPPPFLGRVPQEIARLSLRDWNDREP